MNSAFNRAMKDPFPPARQAGLNAILANSDEYSLPDLAMKMLPGVTPLLCDREKNVRQTALKAARQFLSKIEEASNDPEKERKLLGLKANESLGGNDNQVSATACSSDGAAGSGNTTAAGKAAAAASGWMSSAMSYAGSKVGRPGAQSQGGTSSSQGAGTVSELKPKTASDKPKTLNQLSNSNNDILQPSKSNNLNMPSQNTSNANYDNSNWDDDDNSDYDDGWGDPSNDLNDLDLYASSNPAPSQPKNNEILKPAQSMVLAKNDLAKAKNNMTSKKQNKNKEADIWDDFGGGSASNTKNDDLIDWGGNSNSNTSNQNNTSSNWDSWDTKPSTNNILKPTKASPARRQNKPKKQADDWGEW